MKKTFFSLTVLILIVGLYSSCYYDNAEVLYPAGVLNANCDTTNVTFSGTVTTILNNNCSGCHSSSNANAYGGGFTFSTYSQFKSQANLILGSINQTNSWPMPKGGGKLDACSINQIQSWINKGMINN